MIVLTKQEAAAVREHAPHTIDDWSDGGTHNPDTIPEEVYAEAVQLFGDHIPSDCVIRALSGTPNWSYRAMLFSYLEPFYLLVWKREGDRKHTRSVPLGRIEQEAAFREFMNGICEPKGPPRLGWLSPLFEFLYTARDRCARVFRAKPASY